MSEIKAFNQTADSFKRLGKSITDYTSFVLEYALGWQNCMPAFTTIINNIYLLLIPVGILIGMHTTDFREYSLTFIFYLIIVHAISGVLNKIMYISESFTQDVYKRQALGSASRGAVFPAAFLPVQAWL